MKSLTLKKATWVGLILCGAGSAACDRTPDRPLENDAPIPPVEPAQPDIADAPEARNGNGNGVRVTPLQGSVISAIAQARCAREARCNNIGVDREYASQEACLTRVRSEWRDELNAYECPGGVEQGELAECLEEIRNENCESPFDTLGRIVACRSSDICDAIE